MRFTLRIILILSLMLTGIGLGFARGTVQIGGQVALCTGAGIVFRDVPGQGRTYICPDMALSLLNATLPMLAEVPRSGAFFRFSPLEPVRKRLSRPVPVPAARDPPTMSVAI
ncbi:hypothetical protein [Paracoccus sp. (in: a-proteobacteria)]|uniref:hypothetical protein n=1 Tax=Paracoccus sp. TaxID=267 RepID=UPI003A89841E